jgi:hypothetical protein
MIYHMYSVVLKSRTDITVSVTVDDIALDHEDYNSARAAALLMMAAPDLWLVCNSRYKGTRNA